MIPFSTNTRHNLAFLVGRGHHWVGVFQHVRVITFINLIVLFSFAPFWAGNQSNSSLTQSPVPETAYRDELPVVHGAQPIKTRKKVTYLSPPHQVNQPPFHEDAKSIRSVLVPQAFSFPVVQQPESSPYYVSPSKDLVTEFGLVKQYNNIGLLAHNNLAGSLFKELTLGQEVHIIHTDGHADRYTVSAIYRFQALEPTNTESQFLDLDSRNILTATELFTKMYTGAPHLTFQTCIEAQGDASWGRLFVIAVPAE